MFRRRGHKDEVAGEFGIPSATRGGLGWAIMGEHHESRAESRAEEKDTGRLEAFSDGVFAFAITLLAVDVKLMHLAGNADQATSPGLLRGLRDAWPSYLVFVTSFFSVLIIWVHHHNLFRMVRRVTPALLFANGLLLMVVTVAPFPTAVVAEYFRTPAATAACAFYAGYSVLVSLAFYLLLVVALRRPICVMRVSNEALHRYRLGYRLGPPLYLLALALAFVSPWLTMGICTALWIFWASMTRIVTSGADV
jgi:uncharacterized membrane protein